MALTATRESGAGLGVTLKRLASFIRLEHTVFVLPYAFVGAALAVHGRPSWGRLEAITLVMAGARTIAMSLNRLVDAELDARNPRTASRELPAGLLRHRDVWLFMAVAALVLVAGLAQLPRITWALVPIPILAFLVYPYTKRVTPLCHVWLGATAALGPVGAWTAAVGRVEWKSFLVGAVVAFWMAGFDILYATMDEASDRTNGIHSMVADFGPRRALLVARAFHVLSVGAMLWVAAACDLGWPYVVGVAACAGLMGYEHWMVRPGDLSRVNAAFFNVNAVVACLYLAAVAASLWLTP
jgi:4-hydroxybenzoate polyprenyltransferase